MITDNTKNIIVQAVSALGIAAVSATLAVIAVSNDCFSDPPKCPEVDSGTVPDAAVDGVADVPADSEED